jgi:hypothetical protein
MMKSICSEHSIQGELWVEGAWVPAWAYRRMGAYDYGLLRIEAQVGGEVRVWEEPEAWDFEDVLMELVGSEGRREGPVWRMPVALQVRRDGVASILKGIREIGWEPDPRDPSKLQGYSRLALEGEDKRIAGGRLDSMFRQIPGVVECCETCQFGAHSLYGGGDELFGLYCFRDAREIMADRPKYVEAAEDFSQVAYPHAPAFHLCPSYERFDPEYQQWRSEPEPAIYQELREKAERLSRERKERGEA